MTFASAPPAHAAFPPSTTPIPSNANIECGVSKTVIVPLIIGGKEVEEGMFPWLVAMFIVNEYGYAYKCTTNLISNKHVITGVYITYDLYTETYKFHLVMIVEKQMTSS